MRLDFERHRTLLLQLIEDCQIPGRMLDEMLVLRQSIRKATIEDPTKEAHVPLPAESVGDGQKKDASP